MIKKNRGGRPRVMAPIEKKQVLSHFPLELIQIAAAKASSEGTNISEVIRRLVMGWVRGSVKIESRGVA